MDSINDVVDEYLVNIDTGKGSARLDVYTRWNSMTKDERTGWYRAHSDHLTFDKEAVREGINRMMWHLIAGHGYDGMLDIGMSCITDDHIDQMLPIMNSITMHPAFIVLEEYGEMIDPDVDVVEKK